MAISAEDRSKFAALHRLWWRLQMSEKFSSVAPNKQTYTYIVYSIKRIKEKIEQ